MTIKDGLHTPGQHCFYPIKMQKHFDYVAAVFPVGQKQGLKSMWVDVNFNVKFS